jgi:hypothetical protein
MQNVSLQAGQSSELGKIRTSGGTQRATAIHGIVSRGSATWRMHCLVRGAPRLLACDALLKTRWGTS